jgi:hypothetical protein
MRKIIAIAALFAISSAHAQKLKFGDLNYFLKTGQMNIAADVSSTYQKQTPEGQDTLETRGYLLETRYGYGFNNDLNLYLGLDYAYDNEVENKTDSTVADYHQDGLANPSLAGRYRVLNQSSSMINFDLGAVARINLFDAEEGDSAGQKSNDGNYANGRSSLELNASFGRKWDEANEWQLITGAVLHAPGEKTVKDTTGDVDFDLDPSMDLFVKAIYQYRPLHEFMVLMSAQATRFGEADAERKSDNVDITEESHIEYDFGFTAKYLVTEEFIVKFNYGMSLKPDYSIETLGTSTDIEKRHENFFGLGVDYLF